MCVSDIGLGSDLIDFCCAETQLLWFNITVCVRAEWGPRKDGDFFFPLRNYQVVDTQVMPTLCSLSVWQATTLHHLPTGVSKIPSAIKRYFLTWSPLLRRHDLLAPTEDALDAVIQLLTRRICSGQHLSVAGGGDRNPILVCGFTQHPYE